MKNKMIFMLIFSLTALAILLSCDDDTPTGPPKSIAKPELIKITPINGVIGDEITLIGKNFANTRGSSYVTFANNKASASDYITWMDTLIVMKVPSSAASGEVRVFVKDSLSNAVIFTVGSNVGPPFISRIKPDKEFPGVEITIKGMNFLNERGTSYVTFNGLKAEESDYTSWTNENIGIKVPLNASSGNVLVYVGEKVNKEIVYFTVKTVVQEDPPVIDYIYPSTADIGDTVQINGSEFTDFQDSHEGYVTIAGVKLEGEEYYFDWKDTYIYIIIPEGTISGKIAVYKDGLKSNEKDFVVGQKEILSPIIESLSDYEVNISQTVDIIGENFGAEQGMYSSVTLNGVKIPRSNIPTWEDTKISIVIPPESKSGPLMVIVGTKGSTYASNTKELTIIDDQPTYMIEMVEIKAGSFMMGVDVETDWAYPSHQVTLTRDFYIGKYEVSQREWKKIFLGNEPSYPPLDDDNPVNQVYWYKVVEWCNLASKRDKLEECYTINGDNVTCDFSKNGYRLPTEAEWEYVARAGTSGDYSFDGNIDDYAWTLSNSNMEMHNTGTKLPNPWGIYDMYGNAYEWCWDWFDIYPESSQTDPLGPSSSDGNGKVMRGGSAIKTLNDAKSWSRADNSPVEGQRNREIGFRVVRTK